MMVMSWYRKAQEGGALAVSTGASFKGGRRVTLLDDAMRIFNKLMSDYGIRLALAPASNPKDAQVVVDVANGRASYNFAGALYSVMFDGDGYMARRAQ